MAHSPPSVSVRISLAWDDGPAFEDTDTLVLLGSHAYIDVRVKKTDGALDWAMAGVKDWVHNEGGQSIPLSGQMQNAYL